MLDALVLLLCSLTSLCSACFLPALTTGPDAKRILCHWDLGKSLIYWHPKQRQLSRPWLVRLNGWWSTEHVFILVTNTGALFILKEGSTDAFFPIFHMDWTPSRSPSKRPTQMKGSIPGSYQPGHAQICGKHSHHKRLANWHSCS